MFGLCRINRLIVFVGRVLVSRATSFIYSPQRRMVSCIVCAFLGYVPIHTYLFRMHGIFGSAMFEIGQMLCGFQLPLNNDRVHS